MKKIRRTKYKIIVFMTGVTFLFAIGIIIKSCSLFFKESETMVTFKQECMKQFGQGVLDRNLSSYRKYIINEGKEDYNLVEYCMKQSFPITKYLGDNIGNSDNFIGDNNQIDDENIKNNENAMDNEEVYNNQTTNNEPNTSIINYDINDLERDSKSAEEMEAAAMRENEKYLLEESSEEAEDEKMNEENDNIIVEDKNTKKSILENTKKIKKLKKTKEYEFLLKNFYTVDSTTTVNSDILKTNYLLKADLRIKKNSNVPQILIYHTHSQETFIDSESGKEEDTVVGVGSYLAELLSDKYGYNVIHDTSHYDMANGTLDRSRAYNFAMNSVEKTIEKNPSIKVIIDLHRDGVANNKKAITTINGKKTAKLMFFNGLSRNKKGEIPYLKNPNIKDNLAFSFKLHMNSLSKYPDFTKKIYLKGYRYNLHLKKRSLLIELGNQNNTVAEAKNAMIPLSDMLNDVLTKKQ